MSTTRFFTIALFLSALSLSGCAGNEVKKVEDGQYWQRVSTSESIYMQGPKAQQMLNRSIARCVVELRELERLGAIKNAIPADITGRLLDPDQTDMEDWDTPERDGTLFAEHFDYQDFDGCMLAKGWERVEYLPYAVSKISRENYLKAHIDYKYQSRYGDEKMAGERRAPTSKNTGNYSNLND